MTLAARSAAFAHSAPLADVPEWLNDVLATVFAASPAAAVVGGAYYASFFSGTFGPTQIPFEVEVVVRDGTGDRVRSALEATRPATRWIVHDGSMNGDGAASDAALIAGRGALSLVDGRPVARFEDPRAREHLADGFLAPAEGVSAREAAAAAYDLLKWYPGLRADFLDYSGSDVPLTLDEIDALVKANERGGRRKIRQFLPSELPWLERIRAWHASSTPTIDAVPVPPRDALPSGDPWAAPDGEFREWLIDQTVSRCPRTPRDSYLERALREQRGDQKPTHGGWETYQHAIMATLVLDTAGLDPADRRAARVAAVLHDIGKGHNVWTPGAHALIGAKAWHRLRPPWLRDDEARVVTFLIRTHDMLGLMDRGIVNENYRGALAPAEIRAELDLLGRDRVSALRLMSAIYRADVGSVAALRWLLPLTPLLEGAVLAGGQ